MKQFYPRVQVIHHRLRSGIRSGTDEGDQRGGSGAAEDITSQLGEGCVIHTSKSIFEPAGSFTITLLDRRRGDDSLYAQVVPMDGIEIRAAHDGKKNLRCIMRGFVTSIRRDEEMGHDGKPVRRVTIAGQDVGKLWITLGLYFLPFPEDQMKVLARLGPISKWVGDSQKGISGVDFVKLMTSTMGEDLQRIVGSSKMNMTLKPAGEGEGDIAAGVMQTANNITFYQFMSHNLDVGALYELWMDDPGEGDVQVRWRALWSGPAGLRITDDEIQSMSVWRDETRVSNWFWMWPRAAALLENATVRQESLAVGHGPQDARQYPECAEQFFGFRKLEVESSMFPPGWTTHTDEPSKEKYLAGKAGLTNWIRDRTQLLQDLNKDNARLERCTARLRGNEELRPGRWHKIIKGSRAFDYYAVRVEHEINLYGGFITTMQGERGEGFSGDGSYRAELNLSGVQK